MIVSNHFSLSEVKFVESRTEGHPNLLAGMEFHFGFTETHSRFTNVNDISNDRPNPSADHDKEILFCSRMCSTFSHGLNISRP